MRGEPIVIAGHSHTLAMGVPLSSDDGATRVVPLPGQPRADGLTGAFPRTDDYWTCLQALAATRSTAICWNGNQHLAGLLVSVQPFDFTLRSRPDLPVAPVTLVPELAVRELLGQSLTMLARVLTAIADAGGRPPIILGTPPPKGDATFVRRRLSSEPHFVALAEQAGVSIETIALSTPAVWLKSWIIVQELLADVAAAFRLPFCPCPPETQTADGFLHEQYWSDDVTHANQAYGRLMRRAVEVLHASI